MATTCVLGHPWSDGMVLCPACGFGRRNINQADPIAAPLAAEAQTSVQAAPVLVSAGAVGGGGIGGGPGTEQVLSPDGEWAWDGAAWVPAVAPEALAHAPVLPEVPVQGGLSDDAPPPHRRRGRRDRKDAATAPVDASERAAAHKSQQTRLLIGLVVLAVVVAGDIFLHLPPLGHKSSSSPAPAVVVHHPTGLAAHDAFAKQVLREGAAAETAYRAKSGLYTDSVAVLRAHGMPPVTAPAAFLAAGHHGTGFCLASTSAITSHRWFLYDSVKGGVQPTAFATAAGALAGCSQ
jgi:hypothetical protein